MPENLEGENKSINEENQEEVLEIKEPANENIEPIKETRVDRYKQDEPKSRSQKSKQKSKMTKKKKIIIFSIIAVILIIGIVIASLLLTKKEEVTKEESIKETWGQKYYTYLKDINKNDKSEKAGLPDDMENAKISFYDVETISDPVMAISYELEDSDYTNIYYIDNKKVNNIIFEEPTNIEILYSVENKDYNYYSNTKKDNTNTYKSISDQIKEKIKLDDSSSSSESSVEEYTFKQGDKDSVTDVDGKEISLTKFEQTFIQIETKDNSVAYSTDLNDKKLKKSISKGVSNYQDLDKVITKTIKKEVAEKSQELIDKKEEMQKAKEAVEQKEAEEKAKKEAEEKAKQEQAKKETAGIKVGSYTLKYGTYRGQESSQGQTLVLNSDGTCKYQGASCTYSVGTHDFAQDDSTKGSYKDCIIIKGGTTSYLYPYNSSTLGDGDINSYKYGS